MCPGEEDVQPPWGAGDTGVGQKGENMPPISWGKRTAFLCVGNPSFSFESLQRGALWWHKARIWTWVIKDRSECLFVAGEQGGMGTKGNVNTLLLLGELAAGGAHPTASECEEEHRRVLSHINWQNLGRNLEKVFNFFCIFSLSLCKLSFWMSPAHWKVVLAFWHVMECTLRCVYCKHMVSLFNFPVPRPPFTHFKHWCVCQRPGWRCDASFLARIWFVGQNVTVLTELVCLASCFMSPVNLKGFWLGFFFQIFFFELSF